MEPPRGDAKSISGLRHLFLSERTKETAPYLLLFALNLLLFLLFYGKFGDILIDSSREATVPWRILHGQVPYRDFQYEYGPFSAYLFALLYKLFGVHLAVLQGTGLAVSVLVSGLIHRLCRIFIERTPSLLASVFFVFVFAFQHYFPNNNFNFIFPYSYSATFGIFFLLTLALTAHRMTIEKTARGPILMGFLVSLTFLTKIEIAAAATVFVTLFFSLPPAASSPRRKDRILFLSALFFPLVPVALYFSAKTDLAAYLRDEIFHLALRGVQTPLARRFLGTDRPVAHVFEILLVCLQYALFVLFCSLLDRLLERWARHPSRGTGLFLRGTCFLLAAGAAYGT
ncbi:MAG TPA: hypothetical protein P5079_12100, partial [Elusimicrobiota bacterium]|nr:hypothetical protein [Elusimicrobiota bacterium]